MVKRTDAVCSNGHRIKARTEGTPQGGVISPLLSNIFLNEVFDQWMQAIQPHIVFARYCDDIVIHTRSLAQSEFILDKIRERFSATTICG